MGVVQLYQNWVVSSKALQQPPPLLDHEDLVVVAVVRIDLLVYIELSSHGIVIDDTEGTVFVRVLFSFIHQQHGAAARLFFALLLLRVDPRTTDTRAVTIPILLDHLFFLRHAGC